MKVVQKDNWINLTDNVSIAPEMALKGTMSHLGKKRTMETKKKISAGCLGKKRSDSFKLLKSKSYRGAGNPAHKGFVQTPYGIFETLKDAAIAEGCAISTISVKVNNPNMINYKRVA
jgi:hypothetical protein